MMKKVETHAKRVLVTGASGFIGSKLCERLTQDGTLGSHKINRLIATDLAPAIISETPAVSVRTVSIDLSDEYQVTALLEEEIPDFIFHLAAVVSGDAEENFDKGYTVNVGSTRNLLEGIRTVATKHNKEYIPRLVFSSSLAVFGPPVPDPIPDDFHCTPKTSYGTQKAICELYVDDYSRKGYVDGISIRFPTITVRPGKPNRAASSFFSGIIREPLAGLPASCPVSRDIRHPVASPKKAIEYLLLAADVSTKSLESRSITMPALTVTVGHMIDALDKVTGKKLSNLITMQKDPLVESIVLNWQFRFDTQKAAQLGFLPDQNFEHIIKAYIEDEMNGVIP